MNSFDEQYRHGPHIATAALEADGVTELDPTEPGASAEPERLALYWLYQWHGLHRPGGTV